MQLCDCLSNTNSNSKNEVGVKFIQLSHSKDSMSHNCSNQMFYYR